MTQPNPKTVSDALRVLETFSAQVNHLKAKTTYACSDWSLLSNDDGRTYLSRLIKGIDDDHKLLQQNWTRISRVLQAAAEAKDKSAKAAAAAAAAAAAGGGSSASAPGRRAPEEGAEALALQQYCQSVLQQLDESLVDELLTVARPAKRQRTTDPVSTVLSPGPAAPRGAELAAVLARFRQLQTDMVVHAMDDSANVMDPPHLAPESVPDHLRYATEVRMLCPKVFCASILLDGVGQAAALRVTLDSADRATDMDPWAGPSTQVFRRISALATRVLTYYQKRAPLELASGCLPNASAPSVALEDLMLWLATYRDLFTKRCSATGRLMAWDPSMQYPVPPVFRAFKLPREELRLRASQPSRVAAYHMHAAPIELLGWQEDVPLEVVEAERQRSMQHPEGPPGGAEAGGTAP